MTKRLEELENRLLSILLKSYWNPPPLSASIPGLGAFNSFKVLLEHVITKDLSKFSENFQFF